MVIDVNNSVLQQWFQKGGRGTNVIKFAIF